MVKLYRLLPLSFFVFFILSSALYAQELNIDNEKAGELEMIISDVSIKTLVVNGQINRKDLDFINSKLTELKVLDLKNVKIEMYVDPDDPEWGIYPKDVFPSSLAKNSSIERLILPTSIKSMAVSCLHNPTSLKKLVSYAPIPPSVDEDYPFIGGEDFLKRCTLLVPKSSIDAYKSAIGWNFSLIKAIDDDNDDVPSISYTLSDDKKTLVKWLGEEEEVDMTKFEELANVEIIGEDAFGSINTANKFLKRIILSPAVKEIHDYAFGNCVNLIDVKFNDGLQKIGTGSFIDCASLKSIELPNSLNEIGRAAFSSCSNLSSVILPDGLSTLENSVFYACVNLKSIELPASMKLLKKGGFSKCSSLVNVKLNEGLKKIGEEAFSECTSLKEIVFPESLIEVADGVFTMCTSLEKVTFANVEIIGVNAFSATNLKKVDLKNTHIKSIGRFAFSRTPIENVELPLSIETVGPSAFMNCILLKSFSIPSEAPITKLEERICKQCIELQNISLGQIEIIESGAFAMCDKLSDIVWGDKLKFVGSTSFMNCPIEEIVLPNSVEKIDDWAFYECKSLKKVVLGDNVELIGQEAFALNENLKEIEVGSSLKSILKWAFRKDASLKKFTVKSTSVPELKEDVFSEVDLKEANLFVPAKSKDKYSKAEQWKEFGDILPIPIGESVEEITNDSSIVKIQNGIVLAEGYELTIVDMMGRTVAKSLDKISIQDFKSEPVILVLTKGKKSISGVIRFH